MGMNSLNNINNTYQELYTIIRFRMSQSSVPSASANMDNQPVPGFIEVESFIQENKHLPTSELRDKFLLQFSSIKIDFRLACIFDWIYFDYSETAPRLGYWWDAYQFTPKGKFGTKFMTHDHSDEKRLMLYTIVESGLFTCDVKIIKECQFLTTESSVIEESELENELKSVQ